MLQKSKFQEDKREPFTEVLVRDGSVITGKHKLNYFKKSKG